MQSRSYYFLLVVLGLGLLSGFLYIKTQPKYGLDVKGGVRLTYLVKPTPRSDGKTPAMEDVLAKVSLILQNRISSVTGVAEGNVVVKGLDQVIVEIPGYGDSEKAREQIGTSASLRGYWAKNVTTEKLTRHYAVGSTSDTDAAGNPSVSFTTTVGSHEIKPNDPEYQKVIDGWGDPIFSGSDLSEAKSNPAGDGTYIPEINLTPEAGDRLHKWSSEHRDRGEMLAFVLDKTCIQIAPVKNGQVIGRTFVIDHGSSGFPPAYVSSLTGLLNAGALPADLNLLSSEKIDPTIGQNALNKMIFAGTIAFAVISLFLIIYYGLPGVVAFVALMLYVLFTLTTLKLMGATFSLAAIAGFVLSVGMAVDANILVFERFKEEIKKGKPLHNALDLGFRRALPAIVDSNACSILTSAVLATIGSGPVRGFATTLIIGVAISLFTAVTVTRSLLFFCTDTFAGDKPSWYGLNRNWFGEHLESEANTSPLQIVNNTRKWFAITGVVLAAGIACMFAGGLKSGVDFTGGYEAVYARTTDFPNSHAITANLAKNGIRGANVKFGTGEKGMQLAYITVPGAQMKGETDPEKITFLDQAAGLAADAQPLSHTNVGPIIQKETTSNAIYGVVFSFALIIIYLGFRFGLALGSFTNGLRFGVSAILAGAKDIVVIFGVAAACGLLMGWELSALFITAMLTVIGFSVHDKIVIFDRVRENLRHPLTGETFENLMNRSVTQSFARSINTAAAVVAMLLILILFGTTTPELSFFCVTMLAGIAWGTYSSIYTAAPVLNLWENWIKKNKGDSHTLLATSLAELAKNRVFRAGVVAPTPAAATPAAEGAQRTYGQVRRRASAVQRSHQELDD
ncbi:MAG TPA: protein translocase subunit SecD [Fimbriimonadaceae bacterium]|nr:protein translocase subunit SecD [Fimbriimonadaceae bacterium]